MKNGNRIYVLIALILAAAGVYYVLFNDDISAEVTNVFR